MQRAQETASLLAAAMQDNSSPSVRTIEAFNEVRTAHEGRPITELIEENFAIYKPHPTTGEVGESFPELGERVRNGIRELGKELHSGGQSRHAIVATHGDCVVAARLWALGRVFDTEQRGILQAAGYP